MKAYSLDLRERVVAAADEGVVPQRAVAEFFAVSYSWLRKLLHQREERGDLAPLPHGGGQKPLLDEAALEALGQAVAGKPDATLEELREKVRGPKRKRVSTSTISRALARLGLARKKEGAPGL